MIYDKTLDRLVQYLLRRPHGNSTMSFMSYAADIGNQNTGTEYDFEMPSRQRRQRQKMKGKEVPLAAVCLGMYLQINAKDCWLGLTFRFTAGTVLGSRDPGVVVSFQADLRLPCHLVFYLGDHDDLGDLGDLDDLGDLCDLDARSLQAALDWGI